LAIVSLLALLAFACFPVVAQADSSGVQYSDAPPTATGGKPSQQDTIANSSNTGGGSSVSNPSSKPAKDSRNPGVKSSEVNGSPSGGGAGSDSGSGQGNQDNSSGKPPATPVGQSDHAGKTSTQPGENTSASSDNGGGSSPLVPILIAIAVLAAISVGAVVMRQRRHQSGPGSPVSPDPS
jgi:cobalamin biosynthesis Mg chelatase CobN